MNGPLPAECDCSQASAWSLVLASGLASPPWVATSLLSMTPSAPFERIGMIDGCGCLRRTTTVSGAGARTSSTLARKNAGFDLRLITRSNDHLTSADVTGLPLANRTLGRKANV